MTRTVWSESDVQAMKPEYVAPLLGALCSEKPPQSGQLYEAAGGWFAATRWQRARGFDFEHDQGVPTVEQVAKVSFLAFIISRGLLTSVSQVFPEICNFDNGKADNPDTPQEGSKYTMGNVLKNPKIVCLMSPAIDHDNTDLFPFLRLASWHKKTAPTASTFPKYRLQWHSHRLNRRTSMTIAT